MDGNLRLQALQLRRRALQENPPVVLDRELDQAGAALLHQLLLARHEARLQRGVRRADGRMAGERQLVARREDAQPVVRLRRTSAERWSRRGWSSRRCAASARVSSASAPITTATGLPRNGLAVKTSTCLKRRPCGNYWRTGRFPPATELLQDSQQVVMRVGEHRQAGLVLDLLAALGQRGQDEQRHVARDDDLVGGRIPVLRAFARRRARSATLTACRPNSAARRFTTGSRSMKRLVAWNTITPSGLRCLR